jgi:ATP-dependent helicase/DNAse subunit B
MAEALLITRDDLVRFTATNGNMDTDTFIQWIKVAQDIHIQQYTGTELLNKIKTDIVNNTLANPYLDLVETYLKPMLIHWAMVEFLPFQAYTIANKGIFKHSSENASNVDKNEVDFLIEKQRYLAQNYTERFIQYMAFSGNTFPEYYTNSNSDIYPNSDSNYMGWVI